MHQIKAREIRLIPISDIKLNPKNRNKHPKEQIDRLTEIIKYQGFRRPVSISNRTGLLVCGEGRYLAAKNLNFNEIPAIFQDYDGPEQEFADAIADNAIDKWSELDTSGIIDDVKKFEEFELDLLGIKDFRIVDPQIEPQCDEDAVPEYVEPKTKLGDIYQLGRHRLMCGDSTSIDAVEKIMNGEKADMVFTDPPYNLGFEYNSYKDNKTADEYRDFCLSWFHNLKTVADKIVITPGTKNLSMWCKIEDPFHIAVWVKKNWITSCQISNLQQWEPILFYGTFTRTRSTDLYEHTRKNQLDVGDSHTCPKQVDFVQDIVEHYCSGNIVFDCFGGSGTTIIVAEKLRKSARLIEFDPKYCDVIVARWEKYTGQKAYRLNAE